MRTDLEITKVDSFQNVKNVIVYLHKENNYVNINESNYSNHLIQNIFCCTCPPFYSKSLNSLVYCTFKITSFENFKSHCSNSEYLIGECILFRKDDDLPDLSIYQKHRRYGYLANFLQNKDDIYLYNVKQNRFIKCEYSKLCRTYTKNGCCAYCPCSKKFHSVQNLFKHLEILESRFSCYLVLDSKTLIYDDEKNRKRINNYIEFIESGEINNRNIHLMKNLQYSRVSTETLKVNDKIKYEYDLHDEQELDDKKSISKHNLNQSIYNDEIDHIFNNKQTTNEFIDDNISSTVLLDELELNYMETCAKLNNYIKKLKNVSNHTSLKKALIDNQNDLILIKKIEDFELNTKEFIFKKCIQLNLNELEYLDKKYNLNLHLYDINKIDFKVNLELEEFIINEDQFTNNFAVSLPNIFDEFKDLDKTKLLGSTFSFKNTLIKIRDIFYGDGHIDRYDTDDDDNADDIKINEIKDDNLNNQKEESNDNLNNQNEESNDKDSIAKNSEDNSSLIKIKIEPKSDELENKDKSNIVYEKINLENCIVKIKRETRNSDCNSNKRLKTG